jgi:hypothetical protein
MFFSANNALGPPYHILLDTNFINFRSPSPLFCITDFRFVLLSFEPQHPEQIGRDAGGDGLLVRQMHHIHQVCCNPRAMRPPSR